jgi:hypothetical protein
MNSIIIETQHLRVISGTAQIADAAIHNRALFSELLKAIITPEWPHELLKDADHFLLTSLPKTLNRQGGGFGMLH